MVRCAKRWCSVSICLIAVLALATTARVEAKPPGGGGGGGGAPPVNVRYTLVPLGSLGSGWSRADDMNNQGDVVGQSSTGGTSLAFVYPAGAAGMMRLDNLVDPQLKVRLGNAYGINDLGQVVGTGNHLNEAGGAIDAFNYRLSPDADGDGDAELEQIGASFPNFAPSYGFNAINNDGDLAGTISVGDVTHAALYSDDHGIIDLGTLNGWNTHASAVKDRGNGVLQVCGTANSPTGPRAWRYTGDIAGNGSIQDLGVVWTSNRFSYGSRGADINSAGEVAGLTTVGKGDDRAARYTDGSGWKNLGTLAATSDWNDSEASALNDTGHVVGSSMNGTFPQWRAFLFVDGFKMTELESLIDGLPPEYVGQIGTVEIANPATGFQFGVICGTVAGPQAVVLVPDR